MQVMRVEGGERREGIVFCPSNTADCCIHKLSSLDGERERRDRDSNMDGWMYCSSTSLLLQLLLISKKQLLPVPPPPPPPSYFSYSLSFLSTFLPFPSPLQPFARYV